MAKHLTDQYGNAIPPDLVALTWDYIEVRDPQDTKLWPLSVHQEALLRRINRIDWYEVTIAGRPYLAVSWRALTLRFRYLFDPEELPDGERQSTHYVAHSLKRYNAAEGFYHA